MNQSSVTLSATKRDPAVTKARNIRVGRQIPAVYYGAGVENISLTLDYQIFRRTFKETGESTVIDLTIEGEDQPKKVLVHKIDYHPVSDEFQHVDFINVDMNKPVTANVHIKIVGIAPAVKELGGVMMHNKTEITVRCLPANLPHEIEVDVSSLAEFHDSIGVADLQIDREKVEIIDNDDVMLVSIQAPKTQEEVDAEVAEPAGEAVPEDVKAEADAEKAAAEESKASDTGGKGDKGKE